MLKGSRHSEETKRKISENNFWKGIGCNKGKHHSKETKEKISLALKGYKRKPISEETRHKLSLSHIGKHQSEETRMKISIANKGKKLSEEQKKKFSFKGHRHSEDAKRKVGIASKGRKGMLGKHHTEITKRKLSLANKGQISWLKGKHLSEEHKRKLSLINRGKEKPGLQGENHYCWKGGVSLKKQKRLHSFEWQLIRKQIYQRDNWTCQICGGHCRKDIQCHHIIPYRITKDNSISNLITLCKSCHSKEEHKYYQSLKPEQLQLF